MRNTVTGKYGLAHRSTLMPGQTTQAIVWPLAEGLSREQRAEVLEDHRAHVGIRRFRHSEYVAGPSEPITAEWADADVCLECGREAVTRLRTCEYVDESGTALCRHCADKVMAKGQHYECALDS